MENALLQAQQQQPAPRRNALADLMMFDPRIRQWARAYQRRYGEAPDVEGGDYNYLRAYQSGVRPEVYPHDPGMPHWPSRAPAQPPRAQGEMLKAPDHETAWMEHFMQTYGVDPNEAPNDMLLDAMRRGIMPSHPR
jgi:hypothetical protein